MVSSNRRNSRPLLYLIDASSYVFRAYHALPQLYTSRGGPTNAVYGLTTMLLKFLRDRAPEYAVAVFDAPGATFRDELFDDYKANRPPPPDELVAQLPAIRRLVPALGLSVREEPGVEADDVIGTLARRGGTPDGADVVIVTGDKDMVQLVNERVSLWDPMRDRRTGPDDVRARFGVEPAQVIDVMALMGDSVDNVPGVSGVGEKTAVALIQKFGTLDAVLADPAAVATAGIRGGKRIAEVLEREADRARLSRELVTIRCDLDLPFDLDRCRVRERDASTLVPLLDELEFFSLVKEFAITRAPLAVKVESVGSAGELAERLIRAAPGAVLALAPGWSTSRPMEAELTELGVAASEDEAVVLDVGQANGTRESLLALREVLGERSGELLGEDLKPLLVVAARHGIPVHRGLFDTRIASYVLNPTQEGHDTRTLVERFLDATLAAGTGEAGARAAAALRLRPILERDLEATEALSLFRDVEMPLLRILADMERRGMLVDVALLRALSAEYARKLEVMVGEIHELAGDPFNIHSPQQLRTVLFERLGLSTRGVRRGKTGLSTDVDVLRRLAREHPLPARILEYRGLSKLMSTYVDALPGLVNAETGRVHTCFHQAVAATGRLSSSDPNLQNIPVRGEEGRRIRAAFTAPAGRVLISADYSQIELRILAHLSGDTALVDAFRRDEDIHARTAAEVFGPLGGLSDDKRRAAKAINFGIIYGMGPARLARELDIAHEQAAGYIAEYFRRYPGVRAYVDGAVAEARRLGYVHTLLKRRRYLPEIRAEERGVRQFAERTAVNTPIQGSAADLIKVAMQRVDRRLRESGLDAWMILQVHDELVFECEAGVAPAVADAVRSEMEGVAELVVPLRVDVRSGRNWAEAH